MDQTEVRIVNLPAMHVACAYGFGSSPEAIAHEKMNAYLEAQGWMEGYGTQYVHFGFNNPNPSTGSPNYGYEIWVTVEADAQPLGEVTIKDMPGGMYAVTRFTDLDKIGDEWKKLALWRERSAYKFGQHQWLENLLNPRESDLHKLVFDLYLPIAE